MTEDGRQPPDFPFCTPLTAGKRIYWCSCGLSRTQPYCDGSHAKTSFKPLPFVSEVNIKVALCGCKKTQNPPYCDGSHVDYRKSLNTTSE
jgi:CDGSH-type Zn-finger protein